MILEMIDEGIAQDNLPDDEPPTPIDADELKKRIAQINRENLSKIREKGRKNTGRKAFELFVMELRKQVDA